jgi:hypothetical protein
MDKRQLADGPGEPFPEGIFASLSRHKVRYIVVGGIAALMHDSPYPTFDTDVCPASDGANLKRLAVSLKEMSARIFTDAEPEGLPFDPDARFLADNRLLNLTTCWGRLDIILEPAGSTGYADLRRDALTVHIGEIAVEVASLADVIRTKEAVPGRQDPSLPILRDLLSQTMKRE